MNPGTLAAIALATLIATGIAWYEWSIWSECREFGHSLIYCMRQVVR